MRKLYTGFLCSFFVFSSSALFAQLTVTQGAALNMTPMQLVQSRLVGTGVTVSNVTFNGSSTTITSNQIGSFDAVGGAYTQLGLSGGIIMSSGTATGAIGPNNSGGFTGPVIPEGPGDPDLYIISDTVTHDAAVLEFDFVPVSDTLKFRYVFGSEEFMEYCYSYNDSFGFFLSGPGINGPFSNNSIDIALMPGSINTYVTIRNLCTNQIDMWQNPSGGLYLQYDGLSYVFTAWHIVTPCQNYHIKLAVADAVDGAWDSGVFLEENSFSSTGFTVQNNFSQPVLGNVAIEGCSNATITFKLNSPTVNNDTINYIIGGTATNGVDYTTIPNSVIIPAGMDSTFIVISPVMDNIVEGTETVILTIPMVNCSGGSTYYDTIYILDNFTLYAHLGNDTTICEGQSVTLHAQHTGGQASYTYLWSTGSTASQVTLTPPVGSDLYYVDVTDGCGAVARDSIIVHVDARPVITNVNVISTVCTGSSTNIVPLSLPGSVFSWTVSCGDVNISGYLPGSGLTINQVLVNTGTNIDTVTYHVSATVAGCTSSLIKDFKVAVIPSADAHFNPPGQSFCSGGTLAIHILSNLSGTSFSWTFTYGTGNLSGASNGIINLISQTLSNSGFTTDTVTYHVLPMNSGCPGIIADVKVAVYPIPDVMSNPALQTICGGNPTSLILSSHVSVPTFSWTASCPSPNITGYGPGNGNSITQVLTNSGTTDEVVTYIVTSSANGCVGASPLSIPVTVKRSPAMAGATTYSVCTPGNPNIVLQSNPSPATFTWTASASSPNITGFSAGSGGTISQTLSNSGSSIETATYAVSPTVMGCVGSPSNIVVTVFPVANVIFTPNAQTICSFTAPSIGLTSGVAGTTFVWNATGDPDVTGFGPGTGSPINQVLTNSGVNIEHATYTVIPSANSCIGTSANVIISVKPLAVVSFTSCNDIITTTNAVPFMLKGGLPLGGSYSGSGVSAGSFNPAIGAGSHAITYTYLNNYGCVNTAMLNITVLNASAFSCGDSLIDVRDNKHYPTVLLGGQCWMATNLNYGTKIDAIDMQRDNCINEKYCLNDNTANCTSYGGLYQWDEVMQYYPTEAIQGLCPPAWHIPSENEWNALFMQYTNNGFAGNALKYTGYSGFNAFLYGLDFNHNHWDFDTFATFLWSSTSHGQLKAWAHAMNSFDPSVSYYPASRSDAFYVRCIKN
jgi:uncharacterized protein (TIGR02145 family)